MSPGTLLELTVTKVRRSTLGDTDRFGATTAWSPVDLVTRKVEINGIEGLWSFARDVSWYIMGSAR